MFSVFKQERDPEGREVIEIGMNATPIKASACGGALMFLVVAYFFFMQGPGPTALPWFMVTGALAVGVIGYAAAGWMAKISRVRVTLDAKAGKIVVANSAGQSEIRMAEVAQAEFGSSSGSEAGTVYRLEFVMKNGERVPATTAYTNMYSQGDQGRTVNAINAALARQMVQ